MDHFFLVYDVLLFLMLEHSAQSVVKESTMSSPASCKCMNQSAATSAVLKHIKQNRLIYPNGQPTLNSIRKKTHNIETRGTSFDK